MPRAVNGWKICTQCSKRKPVSEFHKRRLGLSADGLCYQCKACVQANGKARYEANREEILAQHQEYNVTDAGKVACRAGSKRYRQTEDGKTTAVRSSAKRRALKAKVLSDLTSEDYAILDTLYPVCNYCGHEFIAGHPLYKRTLEHIVPSARGGQHTFDNVVFACQRCNSSKGTKLLEEWTDRWYERESALRDASSVQLAHMGGRP